MCYNIQANIEYMVMNNEHMIVLESSVVPTIDVIMYWNPSAPMTFLHFRNPRLNRIGGTFISDQHSLHLRFHCGGYIAYHVNDTRSALTWRILL